jgi:hypothetical protein
MPKQVASAWRKVIRLSLPNDFGQKVKRRIFGRHGGGARPLAAGIDGGVGGGRSGGPRVPALVSGSA